MTARSIWPVGVLLTKKYDIIARTGIAMQQEQWLALTCINVVHLHVMK
jgi:hypothetical protein